MALPDDPAIVRAVLAYASVLTLLDTTLIAEGRWVFDAGLMVTSLDHAMWFHRPFRFDDWLLYVCDSPAPAVHGASTAARFTIGLVVSLLPSRRKGSSARREKTTREQPGGELTETRRHIA